MEDEFIKLKKELSEVTEQIDTLKIRQCKLISALGRLAK